MAKKKEDVIADVELKEAEIARLDVDFGREDLNLMRDKINEIIGR